MNPPCAYSVRPLARRVQKLSGLNYKSALFAVEATMKAVREMLLDGQPVRLPGIGHLRFGFRKGRTVDTGFGIHTQADSHPLRLITQKKLREQLRTVTPKNELLHKPRPGRIPKI